MTRPLPTDKTENKSPDQEHRCPRTPHQGHNTADFADRFHFLVDEEAQSVGSVLDALADLLVDCSEQETAESEGSFDNSSVAKTPD
jgi:hypothetical protein